LRYFGLHLEDSEFLSRARVYFFNAKRYYWYSIYVSPFVCVSHTSLCIMAKRLDVLILNSISLSEILTIVQT